MNKAGPVTQRVLIAGGEVYTSRLGGVAGLVARAEILVAVANQIYLNGGINLHLELAHVHPGDTNWKGGSEDATINGLFDPFDGYFDELHDLRDHHAADLVLLLLRRQGGSSTPCGEAYATLGGEDAAFAWVAGNGCFTPETFVFAHEVGHLQGASHEASSVSSTAVSSFSYGHVVEEGDHPFRTIMGTGFDVPQIAYFSNPYQVWFGQPIGTWQAFNAYQIWLTRQEVADYRTGDGSTPMLLPSPYGSSGLIWGSTGSERHYGVQVPPSDATRKLTVQLSGGFASPGDADLYVRFGTKPTDTVYDCAQTSWGNNHVCEIMNPPAGTYRIMMLGDVGYSSVELEVTLSTIVVFGGGRLMSQRAVRWRPLALLPCILLCLGVLSAPADGESPPARLLIKVDPDLGAHWDSRTGSVVLGPSSQASELVVWLEAQGLGLQPATRFSADRLEALEARARRRAVSRGTAPRNSGLPGWFRVTGASDDGFEAVRLGLAALDAVAVAHLVSTRRPRPPMDLAPPTPWLEPEQGYLDADPGVDIRAAWAVGARGQGIQVADVEYGWHPQHEEWNDRNFSYVPGLTLVLGPEHEYSHHGTAVAGILFGGDDGYGVTGLVPDIDAFLAASEESVELGWDRAGAILTAVEVMEAGDVLVLEMQTENEEPAEVDPLVWDATRLASDLGIVVVAAAGNGGHDLDAPAYLGYQDLGDSGAILVGAGAANREHRKIPFSCHGNRIDLQAWGKQVLSAGAYLGSSDLQLWVGGKGDADQAYGLFSGTSSATPIVAGVVAALQSFAKSEFGVTLTGEEMRELLVATGRQPPGGEDGIGPIPDTRAALALLQASLEPGRAVAGFTADLVAVEAGGTVQFVDRTVAPAEATEWVWEFPGGQPEVFWGQDPPPITYMAAGSYGATLSVLSDAGWDVESRSGVVTVGSPQAQVHGVARLCGTTLRDSGGAGPMGVAEDVLLTLLPEAGGQRVGLSFQELDMFQAGNCSHTGTRLAVYHGTSLESPKDGFYCGTTPPSPIVSHAANGALTLRSYAKAFGPFDGFEARVDCLPARVCSAWAESAARGWISAVHISTEFSHHSGSEPGGHAFFEQPVIEVPAADLEDGSISIQLETGYSGIFPWAHRWKIWIDYDRDGDFGGVGELFADSVSAYANSTPVGWTVAVPAHAEGLYRLRVAMKNGRGPKPCGTFQYGEVEDYWIYLPPRSMALPDIAG